jgi:quercetin dioxygenase-like cupin family protein
MRLARIPWPDPEPPAEATLHARLAHDGFDAFAWTDSPNATYAAHSHDHDESLWVVAGEITFGTAGGSFRLRAGDRLMLPAGTVHTAEVGPDGATYLIGQRRG